MSLPADEQGSGAYPRQRYWRAFCAALVAVLSVKGVDALLLPDELGAAIWLKPLSFVLLVILASFLLAPVAMLNTSVFLRPVVQHHAEPWRTSVRWMIRIGYGAIVLYALYRCTASSGLRGELLGLFGLLILTTLNNHCQLARRPCWSLFGLATVTGIVPVFLLLRPVPPMVMDSPVLWVTKTQAYADSRTAPVYWQPNQSVYLQWKGKNYRLENMSPAFAVRRHEVITLEGRDLVVTATTGTKRRISLKSQIPNTHYILNMQPNSDGVMLNVYSATGRHSVIRVHLPSGEVAIVPQAWRVRCAETTDRYVVTWSEGRTHQVRDGSDRVLRQHGHYPWHFREWDADPVDDLFAITSRFSVTLIGPDSVTMSTINAGVPISSVTMQPGYRQIWVAESLMRPDYLGNWLAEAVQTGTTPPPPTCRLLIYAYNGRRLGERTILGFEVLRAMPIDDTIARQLLRKYPSQALDCVH